MPGPRRSRRVVREWGRESDYAIWIRVFNVNLFSTALLGGGLFEELKAAQGTIINVTCIA